MGLLAATGARAYTPAPDWVLRQDQPDPRGAMTLAYDEHRRTVVLYGGSGYPGYYSDTWEWDGIAWKDRFTWESYPPPRTLHAMAYDSARDRVVVFGGWLGGTYRSDTWEWDGKVWTERTPAVGPSGRYRPAMAYDKARGRVLLFGGYHAGTSYGDTWEWDGTSWVERTPLTSPPPRSGHTMVYDSSRERVVLFGGSNSTGYLNDTWEWDGTTWTQLSPAASPPARNGHAMAYDGARDRVVLFGGRSASGTLSDTWEWDGTAWTERTPASGPSARSSVAMAYDSSRGRVVLFGGGNVIVDYAETWEWDGSAWVQRAVAPPNRIYPAMAYDPARGRTVLFGGHEGYDGYEFLGDTWEWDGTRWVDVSPATGPSPRWMQAMTYDGILGRVMLFGGNGDYRDYGETWEWDGTRWVLLHPPTSPRARTETAMAYDSARHRVVLFGGSEGPRLSDTWEWDGVTWTQLFPAHSPPARAGHVMAYDSDRERVVLFGGSDRADTWEWDGNDWVERTPTTSPPGRHDSVMAYDEARRRVVLFSGYGGYGSPTLFDTWEWDGTTWTERTPATSPPGRAASAMAYDSARDRVVLFGGNAFSDTSYGDTWEYGPESGCAEAAAVVALEPGVGTDATTAHAALGPPDGQAVSLGVGGSVVVRFAISVENGPGTDIVVFEKGVNDADTNENFRVEASEDGVDYAFVRDCPGDACQVDLADANLARASYVRITDLLPDELDASPYRGADIDAVTGLTCEARVEACNGIDDDGDGVVPSNEIDADGDGYVACAPWEGDDPSVRGGGDCEDANPDVHPGAAELCDGVDDNCDGAVDEGGDALCDDADCCTIDTCDGAAGCAHAPNTTPPTFTTQPTLGNPALWPPRHGYADFTVASTGAAATSVCGIASMSFAGCSSSQAENAAGAGDGDTWRDCVYEPGALHLRAERDTACASLVRVYTSWIVAVDVCGNSTGSDPFVVSVPHDSGHPPATGTIVHAADGSGPRDRRDGVNGTYGPECGRSPARPGE